MTDPIPNIDIAALAYEAVRKALEDGLLDKGWGILIFKGTTLTAGKAVGGPLSAGSPDGTDPAKAPPPTDGPGKGGGRESGADEEKADPRSLPPSSGNAAANPASPAISVDEARAALEAAQDREDAVRGSNVLTALQQGTLGPKAVKALGAKWPMPAHVSFGTRESSLIARLQKAGTIAVGRWCRTHDIKEGE